MKKILFVLLCVPFVIMSGLGYAYIAHKLVRDREPWFTLCLVGGLASTIALLAWCTGIPTAWAVWTLAGTGGVYLGLCLLFGKGSVVEMLVPAHVLAILAVLAFPAYEQARMKAARPSSKSTSAAAHSSSSPFLCYQTSTSSSSCCGCGTATARVDLTTS
jgi:hypothetical protein